MKYNYYISNSMKEKIRITKTGGIIIIIFFQLADFQSAVLFNVMEKIE